MVAIQEAAIQEHVCETCWQGTAYKQVQMSEHHSAGIRLTLVCELSECSIEQAWLQRETGRFNQDEEDCHLVLSKHEESKSLPTLEEL